MNLLVTKPEGPKESRMDMFQNATLTSRCRGMLVSLVLAGRRGEVTLEPSVTKRAMRKWFERFRAEGVACGRVGRST